MSGHSKWNNIKRKKEKTDGQRAKIFTKIGREMSVCVKAGGGDPNVNTKLRDLIAKAKSMNVPNDNIQRIIKKAEGGEKDDYESITYEGYGPSGVAMMVETLTDNRNRTAANLRHYFDKFGGNLGNTGCVGFLFSQQGVIVLDVEGKDEETVMEDVFDAGAEDFDMGDGVAEVTTTPAAFSDVRAALEDKGYEFISADVAMVPSTYTALSDPDDLKKMGILLDHLEDDDDVQNLSLIHIYSGARRRGPDDAGHADEKHRQGGPPAKRAVSARHMGRKTAPHREKNTCMGQIFVV